MTRSERLRSLGEAATRPHTDHENPGRCADHAQAVHDYEDACVNAMPLALDCVDWVMDEEATPHRYRCLKGECLPNGEDCRRCEGNPQSRCPCTCGLDAIRAAWDNQTQEPT